MLKNVLVVGYSQTGQLTSIATSFTKDLVESSSVQVDFLNIEPLNPYPFPWPILSFFDVMPESVLMNPPLIKQIIIPNPEKYDLIILSYQVWFLSPSLPIMAFLKSKIACRILSNTPVITLIGCRNMWLMAQEEVKNILKTYNSILIDNVVLTDNSGSLISFITTPRWMFTGRKNSFWKVIPAAGIKKKDIDSCDRFGKIIVEALLQDKEKLNKTLLAQMGAVKVDARLIGSEIMGKRNFRRWANIISFCGKPGSKKRIPAILLFITVLCFMVVTIVPVSIGVKTLIRLFYKDEKSKLVAYFEQPSNPNQKEYM